MKKLVRYINEKTGEYVEKEYKTTDYYNDNGYLYGRDKLDVRSFKDRPLPNNLSLIEKARLHELAYEIVGDQLIGYRSGNRIKPHTIATIARKQGCSERNIRSLIKKAKEANIIREVSINGATYYMYNPLYKLAVKRISMIVYIAFQDILSKELPQWVVNNFLLDIKEYNPDIKLLN